MKKYTSIGLSIFILAMVVIAAFFWVGVFYTSIRNYRSPLQEVTLSPQSPTSSHTQKVIMVIIGGLGYDDSLALELPTFEKIRQIGANAAIESFPPTYAQTAWATIISGAPPDLNDAPPIDLSTEELRPLAIDTLFARAHEANMQTALLGSTEWQHLIPSDQLSFSFFVESAGPATDAAIIEAALPIIQNDELDFILIHLSQVDFVAKDEGGPSSLAYQQAATQVDLYLDQILTVTNLNNSVLFILSDHGHLEQGGNGGTEEEVIWQPLLIIGENIISGDFSYIRQTDIAPTISTLLGFAPPTHTQGRILFEMLRLSQSDETISQIMLSQQRIDLSAAYITAITGETPPQPHPLDQNLEKALAAFTDDNIRGALELALFTQKEADAQIEIAKSSQLHFEQLSRIAIAVIIIVVWFMTMWKRRGFHVGTVVITTIITVGLYHTLFQLQGHSYSLSSISNFSLLPFDVARRMAVSLLAGGGLVMIFLMLANEKNWLTLLGTGYGFSVLVTFVFTVPFFWGYWQNGFIATWHLPAVEPLFWQISSAFEAMVAAFLGLILPWPIMSLSLFVNLLRGQLSETQTPSEPDILPGLRFKM